jgi:hypothetical protein
VFCQRTLSSVFIQFFKQLNCTAELRVHRALYTQFLFLLLPNTDPQTAAQTHRLTLHLYGPFRCAVFLHSSVGVCSPTQHVNLLSQTHCMGDMFRLCSVSQTVVRGPQVVLGFCPCGPLRLNISPKETEKIKLT